MAGSKTMADGHTVLPAGHDGQASPSDLPLTCITGTAAPHLRRPLLVSSGLGRATLSGKVSCISPTVYRADEYKVA